MLYVANIKILVTFYIKVNDDIYYKILSRILLKYRKYEYHYNFLSINQWFAHLIIISQTQRKHFQKNFNVWPNSGSIKKTSRWYKTQRVRHYAPHLGRWGFNGLSSHENNTLKISAKQRFNVGYHREAIGSTPSILIIVKKRRDAPRRCLTGLFNLSLAAVTLRIIQLSRCLESAFVFLDRVSTCIVCRYKYG